MYDLDPSPQKKRLHSLPAQPADSEKEHAEATPAVGEVEERVPETSQAQAEDGGADALEIVDGLQMNVGSMPKKKRGRPRKSGASATSAAGPEPEAPVSTAPEDESRAADGYIPFSPPLPVKKQRGRPRKSGESSMSAPALDAELIPDPVDEAAHVEPKPNRKARPGKETNSTSNGDGSSTALPKKLRRLNGPTMESPGMPDFEEDLPSPKATRQASQKATHRIADLGPPTKPTKVPVRSSRSRTAQVQAAHAAVEDHSATAIINNEYDPAAKTHPQRVLKRAPKKPNLLLKPSKRQKNGESQSLGMQSGRVAGASEAAKTAGQPSIDLESPIGDIDEAADDADATVNQTRKIAGAEYGKVQSIEDIRKRSLVRPSRRNHKEGAKDAERANNGEEEEEEEENEEEQQEEDEEEEQEENEEEQELEEEEKEEKELDQQAEQHEAEDQNEEAGVDGVPLANADPATNNSNFSPLDIIFQFTDSEERDGECATKWGRIIRRRCASARVVLCRSGDDGPSLDDIAKLKDDLVGLLASTDAKIREHRRVHFKRDAFTYLFRELTLVLEAMHDKLQETEGDITESLSALKMANHFLQNMIFFKDMMDSWKVKVPQRREGDRLIRDVESGLIVPLRAIAKEFRILLEQLKRAEQGRQAMLEAQRQHAAREQELIRQEEELRSGRERRKRWQDLHIVRMQCEPDLARRRRLRFVEPVLAQEIDANGRPFERVPLLGERSAPPSTWIAAVSDREWTSEQETALLDDLQSFIRKFCKRQPGLHHTDNICLALERIFTRHCRPRGALRDFSVPDFAAKMAWIRSGWTQLSQQHGWEIPEWVKKIPLLP